MIYIRGDNSKFERAALLILMLRNPEYCERILGIEYSFEPVYAYALGIAAITRDYRIAGAIKNKKQSVNLGDVSDKEKISQFLDFFNDVIIAEIRKYDCNNKLLLKTLDFSHEEHFIKSEKDLQKAIDELTNLLTKVPGSYDGFVIGIMATAKHYAWRCSELIKYIKANPDADTSEIIEYANEELGFVHDSHITQPERFANFGGNIDEDNYDCLGRWLCISEPTIGYGLFCKDNWKADELLPILEKYV